MVNTLITQEDIARATLARFVNNLAFANRIDNGYIQGHFGNKTPKGGNSVEVRLPNYFLAVSGATFVPQAVKDRVTIISLQDRFHVGASFTDDDLVLKIDDFATKFSDPAADALKEATDFSGLGLYKKIWNQVGTPGVTPTDIDIFGKAKKVLQKNLCPRDELKSCVVNSDLEYAVVTGNLQNFNPSAVISSQYKTGKFSGVIQGFEIEVDENVNTHTAGNFGTSGASIKAFNVPESLLRIVEKQKQIDDIYDNPQVITADGFSNDATAPYPSLKEGDVFTINGVYSVNFRSKQTTGELQQMVVSGDASWDSTNQELVYNFEPELIADPTNPLQNVTKLPEAADTINFVGEANLTYPVSLAFHRKAFTFVSAPLATPRVGKFGFQNWRGLSLRSWAASDFYESTHSNRFDIKIGFKATIPQWACRIVG